MDLPETDPSFEYPKGAFAQGSLGPLFWRPSRPDPLPRPGLADNQPRKPKVLADFWCPINQRLSARTLRNDLIRMEALAYRVAEETLTPARLLPRDFGLAFSGNFSPSPWGWQARFCLRVI